MNKHKDAVRLPFTNPLRKTDWVWFLAFPIYLWIAIIRHEGSHALIAFWEGATIQQFGFLPTFSGKYGFLFGYIAMQGDTTWLTIAAPYFGNLITFSATFLICMYPGCLPRWIWLNMVIIGIVFPLLDTLYNYQNGFWRSHSDMAKLLQQIPAAWVHSALILSVILYCTGLLVVFKYSRFAGRY